MEKITKTLSAVILSLALLFIPTFAFAAESNTSPAISETSYSSDNAIENFGILTDTISNAVSNHMDDLKDFSEYADDYSYSLETRISYVSENTFDIFEFIFNQIAEFFSSFVNKQ